MILASQILDIFGRDVGNIVMGYLSPLERLGILNNITHPMKRRVRIVKKSELEGNMISISTFDDNDIQIRHTVIDEYPSYDSTTFESFNDELRGTKNIVSDRKSKCQM